MTEEVGEENKWKKAFDCGRSKEREMWEEWKEGSKERTVVFMKLGGAKCHIGKVLVCEDLLL